MKICKSIKKNKAFTLVELLAVIVVIAILALIGYMVIGSIISDSQDGANEISVEQYARAIDQARMEYFAANLVYPDDDQLADLVDIPETKINCKVVSYSGDNLTLKYCTLEDNDKKYCYSGNNAYECGDTSLASEPDLLNNSLTPVVYDPTKNYGTGAWVVADTSEEWYNYSKQEWANAVILKPGITKNVGDIVSVSNPSKDDEIKAMYVWIPRYEYKIEGRYGTHTDGTAGTADLPGKIEVKFISRTQTGADSGYRIHPAFTWDNDSNGTISDTEHISGIWVGKFQTTGTVNAPTILPSRGLLINQYIGAQFTTAQKFSTYLTNNTNIDSHMMKNSEWGAVAYLSQSIYGKYGNSMYNGANKEVYVNNYTDTFRGSGYSGGEPVGPDTVLSTMCLYNDITDRGNGTGSCGGGASTTGNIYGVYDMVGEGGEYVMGYLTTANSNYASNPNSYFGWTISWNDAGFTNKPDNKYFDNYTTKTQTTACNGGICYGHAINETDDWYNDSVLFVYEIAPWVIRGSNRSTVGKYNEYNDLNWSDGPLYEGTGLFTFTTYTGQNIDYKTSFHSVLINPGA